MIEIAAIVMGASSRSQREPDRSFQTPFQSHHTSLCPPTAQVGAYVIRNATGAGNRRKYLGPTMG